MAALPVKRGRAPRCEDDDGGGAGDRRVDGRADDREADGEVAGDADEGEAEGGAADDADEREADGGAADDADEREAEGDADDGGVAGGLAERPRGDCPRGRSGRGWADRD